MLPHILALALATAAPPAPDDVEGAPRRGPPNIFISPSGEPFRAAQDAPYASAAWFSRADADGDGKLTLGEFTADAERAFKLFDANGDGVIDGFEINDYETKIAPEILPRLGRLTADEGMNPALLGERVGRGRGRRGGDGGERRGRIVAADVGYSGAGAYGMLNEPQPLRAADADLDGKVTRAEWLARTAKRFALLDDKGSGRLTLDTLPKTFIQLAREKAARARAHDAPPSPR